MRFALMLVVCAVVLAAADLKVDHVTAAGSSLKQLQANLSAIGIETVYGGPHSNGATEMALVSFPDGSYLEGSEELRDGARSLKQLQANLSAIGIETVYGGPHSNGATEMALVSFPDGSYLE